MIAEIARNNRSGIHDNTLIRIFIEVVPALALVECLCSDCTTTNTVQVLVLLAFEGPG